MKHRELALLARLPAEPVSKCCTRASASPLRKAANNVAVLRLIECLQSFRGYIAERPTDSMNLAPASSLGNSEMNTASYRPMVKYHA